MKGQLGDGTTVSRTTPVEVANIGGIITLSAGYEHTVALTGEGLVWAWGANNKGQLGDGTTTQRLSPVQLAGIDHVIAIATGTSYTVALKNDGTVWAWGDNNLGQLGSGTTSTMPRLKPARAKDLSGIVAIDAGARHTIALKNDGSVWAWGDNGEGQLGDSSKIMRMVPVRLKGGLVDVRAISAGYTHSAALTYDGTVWAWGDNWGGQLGDGTNTDRSTPEAVAITDLPRHIGIRALTAGAGHTILLADDGTLRAFGSGLNGELGRGTAEEQWSPVALSKPNLHEAVPQFMVTPTVSPSGTLNGTISPSDPQEVRKGETTRFTVTPSTEYAINKVTGCKGTLSGSTYTTGPITTDCTVQATFKKTPFYTVTLKKIGNGTVAGAGRFPEKTTITLTATPDAGYQFAGWTPTPCAAAFTMPAKNLICTATFEVPSYTVSTNADKNGTITPASKKVPKGGTATFTVTPSAGYLIKAVSGCSGKLSGSQYTTGPITANCTVKATFKAKTYTLTLKKTGDGTGTVSGGGQFAAGAAVTLTATPDSGSSFEGWRESPCAETFTMPAKALTCTATFTKTPLPQYFVTVGVAGPGTVTPSYQMVTQGTRAVFTVQPDAGYDVTVEDTCGEGTLEGNTYTTAPVQANCGMIVTFVPQVWVYTVTATAGTNGTISPQTQTVVNGQTTTFTVTPNTSYQIEKMAGTCGGTLSGTKYTTATITSDCTVTASFKAIVEPTYILSLKTDGTGSGTVSGGGTFTAGTTVKLTATPTSGSTFAAWNPSPCAASFTMPAKALTCTATFTKDGQPSYVPEMVAIPKGCFQMGSPEDELSHSYWGDETLHEVCVEAFEIGKYEVTFEEYDAFADATGRSKPSDAWGRGKQPVIYVDWNDAVAYTKWLSEKTGQNYRLPTEAEWEYAARAGTTTPFWTGQCVNTDQANYDGNYSYGSCPSTGVYRAKTLEVGSFPANPWGLHDTMGNVWEWTCSDWSSSYGNEQKCSTNGTSGNRSRRGGSWSYGPTRVRSASRYGGATDRSGNLGFRIIRVISAASRS